MLNNFLRIWKLSIVIGVLSVHLFASQPWLAETVGKGPHEKVKNLVVNPDSYRPFNRSRLLYSMINEKNHDDIPRMKELEIGWTLFGEIFSIEGQVLTFAEQALFIDGLSDINKGMSNLGLIVSIFQVGIDLSKGETRLASVGAYKTFMGYVIGKGSRVMQISNVGVFFIDYALTSFGNEAWRNREDAWRKAYTSYYKKENPRSVSQWKEIIYPFYLKAEKADSPQYLQNRLDAKIDEYISKFWNDPKNIVDISESGRIWQGQSLTKKIKHQLEEEHRTLLMRHFTQTIFPRLTRESWKRRAKKEAIRMNLHLKPKLNKSYSLKVEAYGVKGSAKVLIQRKGKTIWQSTLSKDKPMDVKITRFAYIKAGFPDKITLVDGKTETTKIFKFRDGQAIVIFGTPKISYLVKHKRKESQRSCVVTKTFANGKKEKKKMIFPAIKGSLYTATTTDGKLSIYGQYDLAKNRWTSSSIVHIKTPKTSTSSFSVDNMIDITGKQGAVVAADYDVHFYSPSFEDIETLEKCKAQLSSLFKSTIECTAKRYKLKVMKAYTMESRCSSTIEMETDQYFVLDGKMKGEAVKVDNKKMQQGVDSMNLGLKELQKLQEGM